MNAGRWQISSSGGTKPVWAPNGRELFFIADKNMLTSVPVQTTPTFAPGTATKLFELKDNGSTFSRSYDVSRDGKRFVVIKDRAAAGGDPAGAPPPSLRVVLNWTEELNQRVK